MVNQGVVITDPAVAHEILMGTGKLEGLDKAVNTLSTLDLVLSSTSHPGLLTSGTNNLWRLVRKSVAPAFNTSNIRFVLFKTVL